MADIFDSSRILPSAGTPGEASGIGGSPRTGSVGADGIGHGDPCPHPNPPPEYRQREHRCTRGFTLLESTVSLVIVGVMLTAAMTVAGQAARTRLAQQDAMRGEGLARQLLSEIDTKLYQQPNAITLLLGPDLLETRTTYNDVDDFNGWSESPPQYASGAAIPGFTGWTRAVKVEWVTTNGLLQQGSFSVSLLETGFKRITITVTSPSGKVTTMVELRGKYGPYDKTQAASNSYACWIGATLQIGSDPTTTAANGVALVNQVP